MLTKSYKVIFSPKGKWQVYESDYSGRILNLKASKTYVSRKDAIRWAVESAKKSQSNIFVHSRDGRVEDSATYSSGAPYLPSHLRPR